MIEWHAGVSDRVSRLLTAHPYWWLLALCAISWVYLVADNLISTVYLHHHASSPVSGLVAWMIMVSAMMLPMLSGSVRHIILMMPRYQHLRLMPLLVLGYASVWLIIGGLIETFGYILRSHPIFSHQTLSQIPIGTFGFLSAAIWTMTRSRRKAVFACSNGVPMRINGWYAYRDTIHFGMIKGISCSAACLPVMLALLVSGHNLGLMMIVTAVLIYERVMLPRETRLVFWMCYILALYHLVP
ncbi:DUF2182 domain-containing protein [Hahella ganghwensis]|uniref:copper chaperone n=1 Tax=Hahella ganghwensis TaxID=286420 RepID=UPI000372F075|nr:DUF2182 domain-containing protein [Hahella ganghwensis]